MTKFATWMKRVVRWTASLLVVTTAVTGCNRAQYRRQADVDALTLIQDKANNPHWALENYTLYVDPRSRMFDPFAADTPPLPPDDPTSHELMHRVDGKRGYPGWHYSGEVETAENPAWLDYLPMDDRGIVQLDADTAMRLARLHSRPYQAETEELYLSALDVSFERFRFDTQFFAGYTTFFTADGAARRGGGGQSRSLFAPNTFSNLGNATPSSSLANSDPTAFNVHKAFTSGADLVVGMANTLLWQFAGPNDYSGVTLLDFSLVQPLLRGAGRDRVMERLTVAERTLLANVRSMERYRQAFYVEILTGRASQAEGPTRRGGVTGGTGFEGFSGSGAGGFGRLNVGSVAPSQTGAGAGQAGGYLGLLQNLMQIRNSEINIRLLRSNLATLDDKANELGDLDPQSRQAQTEPLVRAKLQVAQARQAILSQESRLINTRNTYQTTLDQFKMTLGVPPATCIEVFDKMLKRFYLIDDDLEERREALERLRPLWGGRLLELSNRVARSKRDVDGNMVDVFELPWSEDLKADLIRVRQDLKAMTQFTAKVADEDHPRVVADEQAFVTIAPTRATEMESLRKKFEALKDSPCALLQVPSLDTVVFDASRITSLQKDAGSRLAVIEAALHRAQADFGGVDARIDQLIRDGEQFDAEKIANEVLDVKKKVNIQLDLLRNVILALELAQAQLRAETIALTQVDLPHETAVSIAKRYRHDLMNAKASLADSWRLIEFNADNLESTLNLAFSGDVSNRGDNPLNLNSATGRLRVGLQFDAPIVRLSERNTYRQSLIEYQQAKRNYYQYLDNLSRGLRATIRGLETNLVNFEFQRYAVSVAAEQNDLNTELLSRPGTGGPTAARDAVQALTDLLNAQNDFLSIWINYEVLRRQLDLDLGTMRVDDDGIWVDPGPIGPDYLDRVQEFIEYVPPGGWTETTDANADKLEATPPQPESDDPKPEPPASGVSRTIRNKSSAAVLNPGTLFSARRS